MSGITNENHDAMFAAMANSGDLIKEGSDETFAQDVMTASQEVPVIVDFWAPWCGPCKQLGPALEKAVKAANGAVKMVKIDVDKYPAISQQLRVQSIPAVFGFVGGRPVDGFAGALPDSQIKAFIDKLIAQGGGTAGADPVEAALEQAQALRDDGDHAGAAGLYAQILEHVPENIQVIAGLLGCYLDLGEAEAAQNIIKELDQSLQKRPEIAAIQARLDLAGDGAADTGEIEALGKKVADNPNDLALRFELAQMESAAGENESALEHLFLIIEADLDWNDKAARLHILKIFDALGPMDPITVQSRRRLSAILFK